MVIEATEIRREAKPRAKSATRMKFVVALEDGEDGYILASCPALPGCHSQGVDREDAIANISEAIQAYTESMKKHGEPLPSYSHIQEIEVAV